MTTTETTTAKPVKRPRGEGQWALGYREPLNPNEQFKKDDDPLNVRDRIVNIYSKLGLRQHRQAATCAAGCAGWACTPSVSRATTAPGPATRTPTCSRPSTS